MGFSKVLTIIGTSFFIVILTVLALFLSAFDLIPKEGYSLLGKAFILQVFLISLILIFFLKDLDNDYKLSKNTTKSSWINNTIYAFMMMDFVLMSVFENLFFISLIFIAFIVCGKKAKIVTIALLISVVLSFTRTAIDDIRSSPQEYKLVINSFIVDESDYIYVEERTKKDIKSYRYYYRTEFNDKMIISSRLFDKDEYAEPVWVSDKVVKIGDFEYDTSTFIHIV